MKDLPLVSVVMLAWNRKEDVEESLTHVFESTYLNKEVIVVDNASIDGTAEMVQERFSQVRLIRLPRNIGIEGFNIGLVNAMGKYILVLDDDSYPAQDSLDLMVREFEADSKLGAIALRIENLFYGCCDTENFDGQPSVFWGCGAGLRKNALSKSGLYRPEFFLYWNEADLAIRLRNAGYGIKYIDQAYVYHINAMTNRITRRSGRMTTNDMFYGTRNRFWFLCLYFPWHVILKCGAKLFLNRIVQGLRLGYFDVFIRAMFSALVGMKTIYRERKVVSGDVLGYYRKRNYPGFQLFSVDGIPRPRFLKMKNPLA